MANYFVVERNGQCLEDVCIKDENNNIMFLEDIMHMSYDEIKSYKQIDEFVMCVMDATNTYFNEDDEQTIITLIGEDNMFIWSILIGPGDNTGELIYALCDWKKDGKVYRYLPDEEDIAKSIDSTKLM